MGDITKTYLKAFNNGYLLMKHKPKLLESILITETKNDFIIGLKDGKKTFDLEKSKTRRLDELQQLQSRKPKNRGLER